MDEVNFRWYARAVLAGGIVLAASVTKAGHKCSLQPRDKDGKTNRSNDKSG